MTRPSSSPPLDSWTGEVCKHHPDDLGRYEQNVCHGCGTEVREKGSAVTPSDGRAQPKQHRASGKDSYSRAEEGSK